MSMQNKSLNTAVVESMVKSSFGMLYYACEFRRCNFFVWCIPNRATWKPIGVKVQYQNWYDNEVDDHVAEEIISKTTTVSGVVESNGSNGNNLQTLLVICVGLFVMVIILLLKI
ncbi:hypothetical protein ACP275_01G104600 [Erythranthe tilingii]